MNDQLDDEMLENLDLLMNMDIVEAEGDWDEIENLDTEALGDENE